MLFLRLGYKRLWLPFCSASCFSRGVLNLGETCVMLSSILWKCHMPRNWCLQPKASEDMRSDNNIMSELGKIFPQIEHWHNLIAALWDIPDPNKLWDNGCCFKILRHGLIFNVAIVYKYRYWYLEVRCFQKITTNIIRVPLEPGNRWNTRTDCY